jgi:D-beta-D-heptose 7-phosphate kinase/D-beta-D-heptose 1-phosphate adenosyltransferase
MRIWVNGTFDVLHIGHLRLVQYANSFGDVRVGIDKDIRVKELKGDNRPINNWFDRVEMMRSIKYVDSVVGFSTDEELRDEIKKWNPDIMIVGSDYKDKVVIGSELVKKVLFFDKIGNHSTTKIISHG